MQYLKVNTLCICRYTELSDSYSLADLLNHKPVPPLISDIGTSREKIRYKDIRLKKEYTKVPEFIIFEHLDGGGYAEFFSGVKVSTGRYFEGTGLFFNGYRYDDEEYISGQTPISKADAGRLLSQMTEKEKLQIINSLSQFARSAKRVQEYIYDRYYTPIEEKSSKDKEYEDYIDKIKLK